MFRTVRARLVEELGIDPGPALVAAHRRVLEPASAEESPFKRRRPSVADRRRTTAWSAGSRNSRCCGVRGTG
ncbi:BTAD domain-containing putative transcriptional regulator [Streptomyces sp. NPDC096132]|uniref:BTAD domain-containing putative transcriptional regulator n=1 Tax=Streptomyces sp. NPDC096132 TaxID=3366075 RepID=UPI0037FBE019